MKIKLKLRIADVIIEMRSRFPLETFIKKGRMVFGDERLKNFFYSGRQNPDIKIRVELRDRLPAIDKAKRIFVTYHFQDGKENWRLLQNKGQYIYKSPLTQKPQLILINKRFNRAVVYLLPKEDKGKVWSVADLVYDFLQVLLINYFAFHDKGIFVHAIGLKDKDGRGLLFAGKSGAGKSTSARIWHRYSRAVVLNDDRIVVRKIKGKFFIYGSPWHGDFSDYLATSTQAAPLEKLLFIYHASRNKARRLSPSDALNKMMPTIFPTFWNKKCLKKVVSFAIDTVKNIPCYCAGFVNNKMAISFMRAIE